jgi:adhesin transport system membrane fusion protein
MAIDLFDDERSDAARVQRLKNYHHSRAAAGLIWAIALALAGFVLWAMFFQIDEVASARRGHRQQPGTSHPVRGRRRAV